MTDNKEAAWDGKDWITILLLLLFMGSNGNFHSEETENTPSEDNDITLVN